MALVLVLALTMLVACFAGMADRSFARKAGSPVRVEVVTKNQAALLTTQRLNLKVASRTGSIVKLKVGYQGKTNRFQKKRVRFNKAGSRTVLLLLNQTGRKRLSNCGAKKLKVIATFRSGASRRTVVARKKLKPSPKQCPAPIGPPVARNDNPLTDEATARYIEVLANDESQDGSALSIVSIDDTTATGTATIVGSRVRFDPNGSFEQLAEGQTGSDTFTYTVEDARGETATATVAVEIEGVDDPSSVTTAPALYPPYSPEISDYVIRCDGDPVTLNVGAGAGNTVNVDGQGATAGDFTAELDLAENQGFSFTRSAGVRQETHHVRCLPSDFPLWTYEKFGEAQQQWYMVTVGAYNIMFDGEGVPVWWFRDPEGPRDFKYLPDGTLAWATWVLGADSRYEIRTFGGTLLRTVRTVGSELDAHDLQLLPNGNYLAMTYMSRAEPTDLSGYGGPVDATVLDAELQELTPDGSLVWSWNSGSHIGLEETDHWWNDPFLNSSTVDGAYDAVHMNSAEQHGNFVVISMRHTDAIYKIDRTTGEIVWKLGGTTTPESLTILNDPLSPDSLGGQHDARILPDGTLTFHENGQHEGRPPRAVRFAIDESAGTATLLESISDPDVTEAPCCGSARRSDAGSWIAAWGGFGEHPVSEFTATGERTFKLGFPGTFTYRAHPVPPGEISAAVLRNGMNAQHPR